MTLKTKPSLIILDRDGVINIDSDNYIKNQDEWIPEKGSIEAIKKIFDLNIPVAIATNQSGIGRGYFTYSEVFKMHSKLLTLLEDKASVIKYIALCPHLPIDNCNCRKPNIGMLEEISQKLNITLDENVFFVGDSYKDLIAGKNANCTPILVRTGKGEEVYQKYKFKLNKSNVYKNLFEFVENL